jgi:transglutaminase-like putative cysteine protease
VEIRAGYDIAFQCFQDTPMVLMLSIDPARGRDLLSEHRIQFSPDIPSHVYVDVFGNTCTRIVAPGGLIEIRNEFLITDSGLPDEVALNARQLEVGELPNDVLVYLLGSRYCDTQKLSNLAWSLFGAVPPGWHRVQAICDYSHERICFGYQHARCDRTAFEGHEERVGVCRDFAHLAVTLCRCMNIPARYCTGYSRRHRRPRRSGSDGFQRLVRGLSGRAVVHLRRAPQPSADRPDRNGTRTGRRRCRDFYHVWRGAVGKIYCHDRRDKRPGGIIR